MSGPQHLWSGDWELESSARRDELASGRDRPQPPAEPEPEPERPASPRRPRGPTLRHRLRTALTARRRELRLAGLVAVLILLFAGAAYAVTSALGGGSSDTNSPAAAAGSQAWLGIDVSTSASGGVTVVNVIPGSPAYWAGMEAGDVITRINGKPVYKPSDVTSALDGKHPGDQIQIQFQGSGTVYRKQISLVTPPAGYP